MKLSPVQRAYLLGARRARAKAQQQRDELAERFGDTLDEIRAEMRGVRNELARLRTLDDAMPAEHNSEYDRLN